MKKVKFVVLGSMLLASCTADGQGINSTAKGAVAGTALGAGTGAIIGSATGKAGYGTAIGAGIGALGGALVGYGVGGEDSKRQALQEEQMLQQQEIERQRREIEELKRRQGGDRYDSRGYDSGYDSFYYNDRRY